MVCVPWQARASASGASIDATYVHDASGTAGGGGAPVSETTGRMESPYLSWSACRSVEPHATGAEARTKPAWRAALCEWCGGVRAKVARAVGRAAVVLAALAVPLDAKPSARLGRECAEVAHRAVLAAVHEARADARAARVGRVHVEMTVTANTIEA